MTTLDLYGTQTSTEYMAAMAALIAWLRDRYAPGWTAWTGLDDDDARRMSETWIAEFARGEISPDDAASAAGEWVHGDNGDRFPSANDLVRLVHGHTADRSREERRTARASHCDGTGWTIRDDGFLRPCPACNPALWQVFVDPERYDRWKSGTTLDHLDVGVDKIGGRLVYVAGMPAPCRPAPAHLDQDAAVIDVVKGKRIAWEAYLAVCVEDGREPNRNWFEMILGEQVTNPARSAPARPAPVPDPDEDF